MQSGQRKLSLGGMKQPSRSKTLVSARNPPIHPLFLQDISSVCASITGRELSGQLCGPKLIGPGSFMSMCNEPPRKLSGMWKRSQSSWVFRPQGWSLDTLSWAERRSTRRILHVCSDFSMPHSSLHPAGRSKTRNQPQKAMGRQTATEGKQQNGKGPFMPEAGLSLPQAQQLGFSVEKSRRIRMSLTN